MIINILYYLIIILISISIYYAHSYIKKFSWKRDNKLCNCIVPKELKREELLNILHIPIFIFTILLILLPPRIMYNTNITILSTYIGLLLLYYIIYIYYTYNVNEYGLLLINHHKCNCANDERQISNYILILLIHGIILTTIIILLYNKKKISNKYNI